MSILLVMVVSASIIHAALQPKPFDWLATYRAYDRQPYGSYLFFDQLENFFPGKKIKRLDAKDLSQYAEYDQVYSDFVYSYDLDTLGEEEDYDYDTALYLSKISNDDLPKFNFIGLNDLFYLNDHDARALLLHLYQGNHALISAYEVEGNLMAYLGVKSEMVLDQYNSEQDSLELEENAALIKKYSIRNSDSIVRFKPYQLFSKITEIPDSAQVIKQNLDQDTLGIKVTIGEGSLTYFTMPILFSNYHLLKNDHSVASEIVSQLPIADTFWTNYFLGERNYEETRSILDFIHNDEGLKWAFYLLIFTLLIYFSLRIKRIQRAVPIIDAPKNDTLRFVDSISTLYLLRKDHLELLNKKMIYFLDRVRQYYHLETYRIDEDFMKRLSVKSKVDLSSVQRLFQTYESLKDQKEITNEEFLDFNRLIQKFKHT